MSDLDRLRQAIPELKDASDSEVIGQAARLTGRSYSDIANLLNVPEPSGLGEFGRQLYGGLSADAPMQVGRALQETQRRSAEAFPSKPLTEADLSFLPKKVREQYIQESKQPSPAAQIAKGIEQFGLKRQPQFMPDTRDQGFLGEIMSTGARGLGAAIPSLGLSIVNPATGALTAFGQYGGSAAFETRKKVLEAGGSEEEANRASTIVFGVQGGLDAALTAVTAGLAKPLEKVGGAALKAIGKGGGAAATTKNVAKVMANPEAWKEAGKAYGKAVAASTITEPVQDLLTQATEESYGVTPETSYTETAIESAKAGLGMGLLFGPLFAAGARARAKQGAEIKAALSPENTDVESRTRAMDMVMEQARKQGVADTDVDQWFETQLEIEDARTAALKALEDRAGGEIKPIDPRGLELRLNALVATAAIERLGLTPGEKEVGLTDKQEAKKAKDYEDAFNEAFNEPSGRITTDENGIERELSVGEAILMDQGVSLKEQAKATEPATENKAAQILKEEDQNLVNKGINPFARGSKKAKDIVARAEASGLSEDQLAPVYTLLAENKFKKAETTLQKLYAEAQIQGARDVSAATTTEPTTGTSLPDGGTDLLGGVGAGRPEPAGQAGVPAADTGAGVSTGQTSPVVVLPGQPAAPVEEGAPSVVEAPQAVQTETQGQEAPAVRTAAPAVVEQPTQEAQTVSAPAAPEGEAEVNALFDTRFAKSKNKARDVEIAKAYFAQLRMGSTGRGGTKGQIAEAIGEQFGISAKAVRKIGNPTIFVEMGRSLGLEPAQVYELLGVPDNTKGAPTAQGVKSEMDLLREEYQSATPERKQEIAARMSAISEETTKAQDRLRADNQARMAATTRVALDTGVTEGDFTAEDVEAQPEDVGSVKTSDEAFERDASFSEGMGVISAENREWSILEAEAKAATELINYQSKIDALQESLKDFEATNNVSAVLQVRKQIADLQASINAAIENATPKKAAPTTKATDAQAAARKRWQDAGRDLTKLGVEDLKALREYAQRMKNSDMVGKIDAQLKAEGVESAVQEQSATSVPVRAGTQAGQEMGGEVRRAEKPAGEGKTDAEKATEKEVNEVWMAEGRPPEPINPKVAPLVSALNKLNIFTTLSGDMYGDRLVYVDLAVPFGSAKISGLPKGWVVGPSSAYHTQAVHGDESIAEVWKDADVAAEELQLQGFTPVVRLSRAGGAISASEANKVAAAVQQSVATGGQAQAQPQTEAQVVTPREMWDQVTSVIPDAPAYNALTESQVASWRDMVESGNADLIGASNIVGAETTTAKTDAELRRVQVGERVVLETESVTFDAVRTDVERLRRYPGVDSALNGLESQGLGHLSRQVDYWFVADDSVDFDAAVFPVDGKRALAIRAGVLPDQATAELAINHEIGHVADNVYEDAGAYSGAPQFNIRIVNGQARGMGPVAKEIVDYVTANPNSDLAKHFKYPLNLAESGISDSTRLREEVFAQLWAARADAVLTEDLADFLPQSFTFIEAVYAAEQLTAGEAASAASQTEQGQAEGQPQAGESDIRAQGVVRAGEARFIKQANKGFAERNIAKLPKPVRGPVEVSWQSITDVSGKALNYVVFTNDLIRMASKAGLKSAETLGRLLNSSQTKARELEREVEKIADMYADVSDKFRGFGENSVNRFLFDSTRTGKWGYGKYRDKEMGARFDKFGEKEKAFIRAVFDHGDKMLARKKKIVTDAANSEYDALIAQATKDGDTKAVAKLQKEKQLSLKKYQSMFKIREGKPYAPIKRAGDYVVVAKSKEYMVAEAAKDRKKLSELEDSGDHYHVSFTDTRSEARALERELDNQGAFESVSAFERDAAVDELFSNTTALRELTKLRARVDQQVKDGDKSASKLLSVLNSMYLEALAEGSARKSEMRRRGVDGEVDMVRSFAQQGRADAYFLSSIENHPKVQDALQGLRKEAKEGDRFRKSQLKNELVLRYIQSLDRKTNPWVSKITRLGSIWYLATSPAYYLQNATQPWIMSVPVMAGRHEYVKSSAALFKAYSELGGVLKSGKALKQQFDFDKVPADVRDAISELVNRGRIDIGMDTEMGEFRVEGDGYVKQKWNTVDKALRLAVQKVESLNRLSTAMAAYRLELAKTNDKQAALEYADHILADTHGDYTAFNAPRPFNTSVGKVALQFRKFQLIQLGYYVKMLNQFGMSKEEKAAARKALMYSLGHTAILAGAKGLPGFTAIAWAFGALFGDEDDKDLPNENKVRNALVGALGETGADMVLYGTPTLVGADISGKVGAGNVFSVMPYNKVDLTNQAGIFEAGGRLVGGAAGGLVAKMGDGVNLMYQGDWYKGLEQMLPKGVSDAMRAARFYSEGVTKRNMDVTMPAEDVSEVDTLLKALGISPVKQSVMYQKAEALRSMREKFQGEATQLKRDYLKARKDNDAALINEIRQDWMKLQARRVAAGFDRQPYTYLTRATIEKRKRERRTEGGVQYQRSERRAIEKLQ